MRSALLEVLVDPVSKGPLRVSADEYGRDGEILEGKLSSRFAKLYWGEGLTFEESHRVNFDWYHPVYAHRHTEAELRRWCEDGGLTITHLDAQESGYTVRAVKG